MRGRLGIKHKQAHMQRLGAWTRGPALCGGQAEGVLTMASPTMLKASTLARSSAPSEKWLLSRPMTRPWMT